MKNSMRRLVLGCAAVSIMAGASSAFAYNAGDMILRGGLATVDPREESDNFRADGASVPSYGVGLNSDTQVGLTFTYMFTNNIGLEVLAATPFEHDIVGVDGLNGADIGSTKHLPPTVSVQYYPMDPGSKVQPYVGAGINYTVFFDEQVSSTVEDGFMGGKADMSLDSSVGLALEAGVDYEIAPRWVLNASVWYVDIDTTATIKSKAEPGEHYQKLTVDVAVDPWAYMVGVGYKF